MNRAPIAVPSLYARLSPVHLFFEGDSQVFLPFGNVSVSRRAHKATREVKSQLSWEEALIKRISIRSVRNICSATALTMILNIGNLQDIISESVGKKVRLKRGRGRDKGNAPVEVF